MVQLHLFSDKKSANESRNIIIRYFNNKIRKYGWNAGVGTGAFSTSSTGSTANIMSLPLNIGGVGMGETFCHIIFNWSSGTGTTWTQFVSGDKLRVNFTALNADSC
jgi:hypothetical protein